MAPIDSLEDYCFFLLAYMASVDGSIHATERDAILLKINELFPNFSGAEERIKNAGAVIQKMGKEAAGAIVEEQLEKLNVFTHHQKEALYILLFDVLNADGRVNEEETRVLRKLKGVLLKV